MSSLKNTLKDLQTIKRKFLITRFDPNHISDLDVLVHAEDFNYFVQTLQSFGYQSSSHDKALGGRKKGAQINLTKQDRIKIDLHQDFTWRNTQYLDLDLLWHNATNNRVKKDYDNFLILINTIFERTYLVEKNINFEFNPIFYAQAKKYGWGNTYKYFFKLKYHFFLPFWFVMYTYWDKFHFISFLYYLFFRMRYIFSKQLPYEE